MDLGYILQPVFYIKIILGVICLGYSVFAVVVFNRLRVINKLISQPVVPAVFKAIVVIFFIASLVLLLTTLVIL